MVSPTRRSPWLTAVLYVVLLVVLAADVWGLVFWAQVGGRLGTALAAGGAVVALVLTVVLVVDVVRRRSPR